ncbi:MAG: PDZ domain-containing protein [Polyangiaceae bacterium]|nr:PDZ domain-containing protein [Polyangiaceae bacterium]
MTRAAIALVAALLVLGACGGPQGTVGAVFAQQGDGRLLVHEAPKGLAAEKAGLAAGDEVLLIDGMDVRRLDDKALHRALSGEVGSSVKLTVLRGEEVLRVTLKRTPAKKRVIPAGQR